MLTGLHIQDYVLIDKVRLPINIGLTALTGETGAGKSILLDALGLAVGGRAERGAVRAGAERGAVTAIFEPNADHLVWRLLRENDLDIPDDQVILRRVLTADGRARAFINDQPVSVAMLRRIGESLLEIHGQHDGRGFLTVAAHRGMLDEFGGLSAKAKGVRAAWREWSGVEAELAQRKRQREAAQREADYLRHVVETLETLDPQESEEETLAARRAHFLAAGKILDDLRAAAKVLDGGGFENDLAANLRHIERASAAFGEKYNPLADVIERLDRTLSEAMEARASIEAAIEDLGGDPDEVDRVEERLFALRAEARKHGVAPDGLRSFLEKTKSSLSALEVGEAEFEKLETGAAERRKAFMSAARGLSLARAKAAKKLDKAVAAELGPLKLGRAVFRTAITTDEENPGSDGFDAVEFMVATNPGAPEGPLKTIASGGELSRFVLAMKAALAAKEDRTVIIFDEVDAGVGGAVADAIGERLSRLAAAAQVLVVTHSPQVAARAHHHWRVSKRQSKAKTTTEISVLDPDDRTEEVARMLSGAEVTDEARAAAGKLLAAPAQPKKRRPASKARAAQ